MCIWVILGLLDLDACSNQQKNVPKTQPLTVTTCPVVSYQVQVDGGFVTVTSVTPCNSSVTTDEVSKHEHEKLYSKMLNERALIAANNLKNISTVEVQRLIGPVNVRESEIVGGAANYLSKKQEGALVDEEDLCVCLEATDATIGSAHTMKAGVKTGVIGDVGEDVNTDVSIGVTSDVKTGAVSLKLSSGLNCEGHCCSEQLIDAIHDSSLQPPSCHSPLLPAPIPSSLPREQRFTSHCPYPLYSPSGGGSSSSSSPTSSCPPSPSAEEARRLLARILRPEAAESSTWV